MKHIFTFSCLALILSSTTLSAQTTDQISTGAGYTKFAYYKLSDGSSQQVANDAWDIAFSNFGPQSAGVFINESTSSSQGQTVPGMEVYDPFVFDFNDVIDPTGILPEYILFNPEKSWDEGAFNTTADSTDALDFGWGYYETAQSMIVGYRVYVLKLRNGEFRKIIIDSYDGAQYNFRVAKLDGSNLTSHTVQTNFGNGSPVVYFSLGANGSNVVTPTNWDLVLCRYVDILYTTGDPVPYPVTGVLTADSILTARATNVDPVSVDYNDYLDSFSTRLDVINHDWKFFNLSTGWVVESDRAYFVKTPQNSLYKLVFTAFGGSTNGTATVQRTYLGTLLAAPELPDGIKDVLIFPNPAVDRFSLSFTSEKAANVNLQLVNSAGQTVWSGNSRAQTGLNVMEINALPSIPSGMYVLNVLLPEGQFSRSVVVRK